jgi:hypothetical protein
LGIASPAYRARLYELFGHSRPAARRLAAERSVEEEIRAGKVFLDPAAEMTRREAAIQTWLRSQKVSAAPTGLPGLYAAPHAADSFGRGRANRLAALYAEPLELAELVFRGAAPLGRARPARPRARSDDWIDEVFGPGPGLHCRVRPNRPIRRKY